MQNVLTGIWYTIHSMALFSTSREKMEFYVEYINYLSNNFPCTKCIIHFKNYIKNNNPSKYFNVKDGLFKWSVEFHNAVNVRLGKPVITLAEAYKIYTVHNVCTDCGSNTQIPKSVTDLIQKASVNNGVTFF